MLFKAVVFRPDGHSDFMTGPEGYSTSVLAGDDPVTVVPDLVQSSRVGGEPRTCLRRMTEFFSTIFAFGGISPTSFHSDCTREK